LMVASEALSEHDAWYEVPESTVLGVDERLLLRRWRMSELAP